MCSFDVVSLFTNVPIDETVRICLDTLYRSDLKPPTSSEDILKNLLVRATQDVEFSFNDTMFRQTYGVAMGSPLGPVLANIFLGFHEYWIPEGQWPRLYRRFVDDTFSLVESRDSAVKFLHCLNDLHSGVLKFTVEGEEERRLPFMDVLVRREQNRFTSV